ncbi:unnamed protein product, partial [Pleuronectes platessa]
ATRRRSPLLDEPASSHFDISSDSPRARAYVKHDYTPSDKLMIRNTHLFHDPSAPPLPRIHRSKPYPEDENLGVKFAPPHHVHEALKRLHALDPRDGSIDRRTPLVLQQWARGRTRTSPTMFAPVTI